MSEFERSIAIVIGINKYQNGISPLQTAAEDAKELSLLLALEHKYEVIRLLDEQATLENLRKLLLEELPREIKPCDRDRVLFYFAGHGIALNDENGPAGYLVPQDAKPGNSRSFLPMQDLHDALIALNCRHLIAILDCCFAGTFRWSSLSRDLLAFPEIIHKERYDRFITDPAWQAITSAGYDQKALDVLSLRDERGNTGQNHSPFAQALFDALRGAADHYPLDKNRKPLGDGVITAQELILYLRDGVELPTEGNHKRQTPGLWPLKKHDKGEYIFLVPGHPLNLPDAPKLNKDNNPYRGLKPFEEQHSKLFFGRSRLIEQLLLAVEKQALTLVLGASGTGKSSLVKAGLIPRLRSSEQWHLLAPMRPGESPFTALARVILPMVKVPLKSELDQIYVLSEAIREAQKEDVKLLTDWNNAKRETKLLLAIEHFEKLVTLCENDLERQELENLQQEALADIDKLSLNLQQQSQKLSDIVAAWSKDNPNLKVLLVVDQFEELVTLCRNDLERQQFLSQLQEAIAAHPQQLRLVLTLRSDFEPQFLDSALKSRWMDARFVVTPMTQDELRQVIEQPASERVLYFESDDPNQPLVDQIINEVVQMPGALPLLSFTLSELYLKYVERRGDNRALTEKDYRELGGVIGSLTQRATQEYNELVQQEPAYEQTICQVMLRMVAIEGAESARRRVSQSELVYLDSAEYDRAKEIIRRFSAARLIVEGQEPGGEAYVEPAHDALVRGWDKLRTWINQNPKTLTLQQRLTPAVNDWLNNNRAPDFLWDEDPRIELLKKVSESKDNWLNQLETEFVNYSLQQRLDKLRDAEKRAKISLSRQLAAQSLSNLNTQFDLALLLGVEANRVTDTAEARSSLLNGLQHSPHLTAFLRSHVAAVSGVAFSPDGKTLASASADGSIVLWNADTCKAMGQLQTGQSNFVSSLAYSPDGKILASGGGDGTIVLWDTTTCEPIDQLLTAYPNRVRSLAFSPDGKTLASGSSDREPLGDLGTSNSIIVLWDISTRQPIAHPLMGHIDRVRSIAFSPDGKTLASSSCGEFHPSGICKRGEVRLWDIAAQQQMGTPLTDDTDRLESITFSPDGKIVAAGDTDGIIILWDVVTGQKLGKPLIGHTDSVFSVVFSPDGQTLASGSKDKSIILWNVEALQRIDQLTGHTDAIYSLAFSSDGKRLASGSEDSTVILWDMTAHQRLGQPFIGNSQSLDVVAFSPDGKMLASGGSSSTITLWDVSTRQQVGELLANPDSNIKALAFSGDSQILASGDTEGEIVLWDVTKRERIGQPLAGHQHGEWITSLVFSQNSQILASGSHDETVILWDVVTRQPLGQPLTGHQTWIYSLALSPDAQTLASGDSGGTIILWEVRTRQQSGQPIAAHARELHSVVFSPDGKILASGGSSIPPGRASNQGEIRLWDVATGQQLGRTLTGHTSTVSSVAFSSDSKTLASSSWDGSVILWDVGTGQPLGSPLPGHNGIVSAVAFSPDGKTLVSGSYDQTIILWDVSLETWQNHVCNIVARNLTLAEWAQYFPDQNYHKTCAKIPVHPSAIEEVLNKAQSSAKMGDSKASSSFYTQAVQWAVETDDSKLNNNICWYGSIDGFPEIVLPAGERAVELAPSIGIPYDSRGLARALIGDYAGAIEDFKFYVQWLKENNRSEWKQQQREVWITELEANRNPLNRATVETLRDQ
jgi:WD40 repeat protein/energy-coupling factor transporter ATP-binding protein EcfA2